MVERVFQRPAREMKPVEITYRLTPGRRILNLVVTAWLRLGLPPQKYHSLTVRGRNSGRLYSTPVAVVEDKGQRWLVAPYGERAWVKNARAAGRVVLTRGLHSGTALIREELDPLKSAPVLKMYLGKQPMIRRFFDVTPRSSIEDFIAEAPRHPVFEILESLD